MIWPHGNFVVGTVGATPPGFLNEECANHANHVGATVQMCRFVERAIGFAGDLTQVCKMDARSEFADHGEQIIVRASSKRAYAKGEAVRGTVLGGKNRLRIIGRRDDARQTKQRPRRIVRVNGEPEAEAVTA